MSEQERDRRKMRQAKKIDRAALDLTRLAYRERLTVSEVDQILGRIIAQFHGADRFAEAWYDHIVMLREHQPVSKKLFDAFRAIAILWQFLETHRAKEKARRREELSRMPNDDRRREIVAQVHAAALRMLRERPGLVAESLRTKGWTVEPREDLVEAKTHGETGSPQEVAD